MAKSTSLTATYEALPQIAKLIIQFFLGAIVGGIYRIVRFVEKAGSRTKVSAKLFAEIESVAECDLLERNDVAVDIANGDSLNFEINPFEIKCYKIKVK